MKYGTDQITEERVRQIEDCGFDVHFDVKNNSDGQLVQAAIAIIEEPEVYRLHKKPLNWDADLWAKMCAKPQKERLVLAGTWNAAEIDRQQEVMLNGE